MGLFKNARILADELGGELNARFASEITAAFPKGSTPSLADVQVATLEYMRARGANPPQSTIDEIAQKVLNLLR